MEYRNLGTSELKVSQIGLGTMNFGWYTDEIESIRLVHEALEEGINFFDSADVYSNGLSETYLGKALKGRREQAIIATKVGAGGGEAPDERGNHPKNIFRQVEDSLQRLGTDYIDLYQLHHPDPNTPLEDSIGALSDLVQQGKIRYAGTSNFAAWQIVEGQWAARSLSLEPFISHQSCYSLLDRRAEREVIPVCQKYRLGLIPWSPLAGGWLARPFDSGESPQPHPLLPSIQPEVDSLETKKHFDALAQLNTLVETNGRKLSQFAISWVLANSAVTTVLIGPQDEGQLRDSLKALDLSLKPEELTAVEDIIWSGDTVFV